MLWWMLPPLRDQYGNLYYEDMNPMQYSLLLPEEKQKMDKHACRHRQEDLPPHRTCIYLTCGSQRSTRRVTRHRESRDDTPTRTDDHTQLTTSTQIAYRHQPRLIVPPTIILILPSI